VNIDKIKEEVKIGLLPTSILNYYVIYSRYDYYRKLGNYVGLSILFTAECFKISERKVYRAKKEMEEEV
jgi:hypothetical protein